MDIQNAVQSGLITGMLLLVMTFYLRDRFGRIEKELDRLSSQTDARFGQVDQRLNQVSSEIAALRSDLTQVALAVGARTRPNAG